MDFEHSEKVKNLLQCLEAFMDEHIYPNQRVLVKQTLYCQHPTYIEYHFGPAFA